MGSALVILLLPAVAQSAPGCGTRGAINGTSGSNVLNGTKGNDVICGHGGNDVIYGHGGHDTIYGGTGNDKLYGGTGVDRVAGDAGVDTLYGESGNDLLYGAADNDRISAGSGNDLLKGEAGDDKLDGESGTDTCVGDTGYADTVHDFTCERRGSAERLTPGWTAVVSCAPNDIGCLAFSGYAGKSVAGFPVCSKHNCTNYAAYRLAKRNMPGGGFPQGNAYEWDNRRGALTAVSASSPAPGDIAQWESFGTARLCNDGKKNCGHVAYVERVSYTASGAVSSIVISESSWCIGGKVVTVKTRDSKRPWPTRFLRWNR